MATGTSVGSFLGDSMKWRLEYCFISAGFLQSSAIVSFENSKAVSPPASLADATYFWCGKSRQNRSCREGARQTAPGPLRCSVQAGRAELAPFGRSDMRRVFFRLALCFSAPSRQMGWPPNLGWMSERMLPTFRARNPPSPPPSIAAADGAFRFRMSERPKGASSEPAVRGEKRREPDRRLRQQP